MLVTVNGQQREVPEGTTVAQLLAELGKADQPCAVEVNRGLVTKSKHAAHALRDGDTVEIVTLVGGG